MPHDPAALRRLTHAQPGMCTDHTTRRTVHPWTPLTALTAPQRITPPAQKAAEPPAGAGAQDTTPETAQAESAGHNGAPVGPGETVIERDGHHTTVWETVGAGWVWSCPPCDARGHHLPDYPTALGQATQHANGSLPWWHRILRARR